jgi:esterase FrsA
MHRRDFLKALSVAGLPLSCAAVPALADERSSLAQRAGAGFEPFPFSIDELFAERAAQFLSWGIPPADLERARGTIVDAWRDSAGGWSFEWNRLAEEHAARQAWLPAALCLGAARFPVAATPLRREATERQIEYFVRAAAGFPMPVRRRVIDVSYRARATPVALHEYLPRDPAAPLVLVSGGVDTFKIEMHQLCLFLGGMAGLRVAAVDMPGTGESQLPLAEDAEVVYLGVLRALRGAATAAGVFGMSFGGHWALKLGLLGAVDFAVAIGGPTGEATPAEKGGLPNGMGGILRAALGMPQAADHALLAAALRRFDLSAFALDRLPPTLIVNGELDPYVPPASYARLRGSDKVSAWIVRGDGHCAARSLRPLLPALRAWIGSTAKGEPPEALAELEKRIVKPLLAPL